MSLSAKADVLDWYDTNYVGFAGFTIMLWDHIDTFVTEVELIWMKEKSLVAWLFLLNRYLIPTGFIINLFAYLYQWPQQRTPRSFIFMNISIHLSELSCSHFVRYEGSMTMIGISVAEIMMFLRIRCLYNKQKFIHYGLGLLFLIQTGVNAWLLTEGRPVPHTDRVKACTMIFDNKISKIATASAWLPLLYDTVVFVLTLNRVRRGRITVSVLKKRLVEDGIIYYSAIFTVTLALSIMIATAPPGTQNISAQLELLITVTMMSRITLNLKKVGNRGLGVRYIDIRTPTPIRFASADVKDCFDDE